MDSSELQIGSQKMDSDPKLALTPNQRPPRCATRYLTYAKTARAPAPIEVKVYPGGQHAWTVSSLGAPRFYPQYGSTRKCPFILLGRRGPALLIDGQAKPFDANAFGTCLRDGQGYSMAYSAELRAESVADAVAFLRRQLMP